MKLNDTQVAEIKKSITNGEAQAKIASQFGVSRSLISDIATDRAHKNVAWPGARPIKKAGGQRKALYDPTDERIQELESEVAHLTEEKNLAKRAVKTAATERGIFKAVAEEMEKRVKPFTALPSVLMPRLNKAAIEETVVMHLSDGHHDQVVRPEECGGLEEYNFDISCRRAERYVDTVIDWTTNTLSPKFHFNNLTVLAYGDHTSGEIHDHEKRSHFRNQFRNSFAIGQLHALMYRDLAPHFDSVNVVYLPGNHGRRTPKKEHQGGAHNNWDYLVGEIARLHCHDIPNISFLIPDAFSINLDINGVGFNVSHGDDVKGHQSIPFYGMVRRQKSLIALRAVEGGPRVRYFVMGHHHVAASLADVDGEMIVNGAWVGTDAYCYNSFAGYREPCQWIHGVHPRHGVTWRLGVHLRSRDEKKGPKRYKVKV